MKKSFLTAAILTVAVLTSGFAQKSNYPFFTGDYEQLQTRAKNASKPYMLFFYANWSDLSKRMLDSTFGNAEVQAYGGEHYLASMYDGESVMDQGRELAQRHRVMYYPTVILFTPEGKEVARVNTFADSRNLLAMLKKHRQARGEPEPQAEVAQLSEDMAQMAATAEASSSGTLVRVAARPVPRTGFAVQVAVFSNYRNTFSKVMELEEERFHHNVLLHMTDDANGTKYKLVLGPFAEKAQADAYQRSLVAKDGDYYSGSMVIDLSK